MSVEEHIKCLGLGGNRQTQMRDNYGSMGQNWDSQHVGYDPTRYQSGGYGYQGNYNSRHDSFDRSFDFSTSDTHGIERHGLEYRSSSTADSSSEYRGFIYYNRRDETLLQNQSSHSNDLSSSQSNQYPYGQLHGYPNVRNQFDQGILKENIPMISLLRVTLHGISFGKL